MNNTTHEDILGSDSRGVLVEESAQTKGDQPDDPLDSPIDRRCVFAAGEWRTPSSFTRTGSEP